MRGRRTAALPVVLLAAVVTGATGCSGGSSSGGFGSIGGGVAASSPAVSVDPAESSPEDPPVDTDPDTYTDTYSPDPEPMTSEPVQDDGPGLGSYAVTISGSVGGNGFERSGTLRIIDTVTTVGTTNGVNPVDVCLVSGFPAATPEVGAIWLGSNSACDPGAGAADIDLGDVEVDGATVTFEPDEQVAATLNNLFTESSGLVACPYAPVSGRMEVSIGGDGGVSGSVEVTGYGGADCGSVDYQAEISG